MRRFSSFSGKVWFVVGLITAAVLMPATVLAAASLVKIQMAQGRMSRTWMERIN